MKAGSKKMNEILTIIQTVGFPIACVFALGWFVLKLINDNRQDNAQRDELHRQEVEHLKEAIDNNTKVMTAVLEKLGDV